MSKRDEIQEKIDKLKLEQERLEEEEIELKRKEFCIGEVFATGKATHNLWAVDSYTFQERFDEIEILTASQILGEPTFKKDEELSLILDCDEETGKNKEYCWCDKEEGLDGYTLKEESKRIKDIIWIRDKI